MVRTQIQLKEEQARRLRKLARREGVSLAEIIRRCVDHALTDQSSRRGELYERAAALIGRFRDREGADDLAAEHDRYLDEAASMPSRAFERPSRRSSMSHGSAATSTSQGSTSCSSAGSEG